MFDPKLSINEIVTEAEIHNIFGCQTTFGIRSNKKNNAFVIVSDARQSNPYADIWVDDILYYTGTDAGMINGNQTLTGHGNNNGALKDVWNKPDAQKETLFLFVKYASNQCTYKGVVTLAKEPYQEPRKSNPTQTVWKFPLQLAKLDQETLRKNHSQAEQKASLRGIDELKDIIDARNRNPNYHRKCSKRKVSATSFERDPVVSAYVKLRAQGVCDYCNVTAPFSDSNGVPYLEAHHVIWLSKNGADDHRNMVALCPNCHRKMHILDLDADRDMLLAKIQSYND